MSWETSCGLVIKTFNNTSVFITTPNGDLITMKLEDFLDMVYYLLSNVPIEKGDTRLNFISKLKEMEIDPKGFLKYKGRSSLYPPNWREG